MPADSASQEIEQAFMASWDHVEQFYSATDPGLPESVKPDPADAVAQELFEKYLHRRAIQYDWLKSILHLIGEMRKRGYDRQLRAGTSLYTLILSRSRKHGLRPEQPFIYFGPKDDGGTNIAYCEEIDSQPQIILERVELTAEVDQLLDRLKAHPID